MSGSAREIGAKMDALEMWKNLSPYNWAVKPHGTVFPYFCNILQGDGNVKVRFLMLEGWRTLHDYVRLRTDLSFGIISAPVEFSQFQMVVLTSGEIRVFRHDTGFVPREIDEKEAAIVEKILWEAYGVMLRVETDPSLPMRFAEEKSIFARVEDKDGVWRDEPLLIPDPQQYVERISFKTEDIKKACDLPLVQTEALDVNFALFLGVGTDEEKPKSVYRLVVADSVSGKIELDSRFSIDSSHSLKDLWETMPQRFLEFLIKRGRVPGRVRVGSARVFRFLRPLCIELPFRLSIHESLSVGNG